jgi:L-aspartate oxidase
MRRTATRTVFLDMTALDARFVRERFPGIYATCLRYGIDITRARVPVSPAAHYTMGGVRTDLRGRSTIAGLYAAGEVACTGVHGANRLASNSLLEGLVFGARAGSAAFEDCAQTNATTTERAAHDDETARADVDARYFGAGALALRKRVRRVMWERVGILRARAPLVRALAEFTEIARARLPTPARNFLTVATLIARAALWREESRGAHFRLDFPARDDARWRVHSIAQQGAEIVGRETIDFAADTERPLSEPQVV